jgi:hypothetical protein
MTNLAVTNPYRRTTSDIQTREDGFRARGDAREAKTAAKLESAREAGRDVSTFARGSVATSWFGLKSAGRGTVAASVGAAQAGAAAGFAVAGAAVWVGEGAANLGKKALGGLSRGFLAISNAFARSLGQEPAVLAPVVTKKGPSLSDRLFGKMKDKLGHSGDSFRASGQEWKAAGKVGVVGTAAGVALATYSTGVMFGRYATTTVSATQGAALFAAEKTLAGARNAVKFAEAGTDAARRAALAAANATGRPAGLLPVAPQA